MTFEWLQTAFNRMTGLANFDQSDILMPRIFSMQNVILSDVRHTRFSFEMARYNSNTKAISLR